MLPNPSQHGLAVRCENGVPGALRLVVEAAQHVTDTPIEPVVAQVDPV